MSVRIVMMMAIAVVVVASASGAMVRRSAAWVAGLVRRCLKGETPASPLVLPLT
jgi:hypothetical protein